jgi:hypothetical protein
MGASIMHPPFTSLIHVSQGQISDPSAFAFGNGQFSNVQLLVATDALSSAKTEIMACKRRNEQLNPTVIAAAALDCSHAGRVYHA